MLNTDPKAPVLFTVKVPPCTSAGPNLSSRAFSMREFASRVSSATVFLSAFLSTGTISPLSRATAMPRLISFLRTIPSSCQEELISGAERRAEATA